MSVLLLIFDFYFSSYIKDRMEYLILRWLIRWLMINWLERGEKWFILC